MKISTKLFSILCVSLLKFIGFVDSSYCGQAAIPFSLEVLQNGQPVLGCARPSCFGWTAAGARSADPAQFYRIEKRADGFFRSTDVRGPIIKNITGFQPQYSICDRSYLSTHCSGASWVGGIAPSAKIDSSNAPKLMCCYYNKLADAIEQGSEEIRAGGIVEGGEIRNEFGRTNSFEYIANIQRLFDKNGEVIYITTMKKFACVPEPPASLSGAGVDSEAANFLIDNILQSSSTQNTPKSFAEQKFDLPNTMPQEDNLSPTPKPAQKAFNRKSGQLSPAAIEDNSIVPNSRPKSMGQIPLAKSMDDDDDEDQFYNKNSNALDGSQSPNRAFAASTLDNNIVEQQENTYKAQQQYNSDQQQQQTNQQQQQNNQQYQQQQQQYAYYNQQLQQQQRAQQSLLDPFGLLWNTQWLPLQQQQQPSYAGYYASNGAAQRQQQNQPQQQYYYTNERSQPPQANGIPFNNAPQPVVQQKTPNGNVDISSSQTSHHDGGMLSLPGFGGMPFTLPPLPTQPPPQLLSAGRMAPTANIVDSAFNAQLPEQPMLQIPTPEEIENAIPATSRRLIANLARTFLGYFN